MSHGAGGYGLPYFRARRRAESRIRRFVGVALRVRAYRVRSQRRHDETELSCDAEARDLGAELVRQAAFETLRTKARAA